MKRTTKPARKADHLMMVASIIDGLRRETSGLVDEAALRDYERLSESLRRCAFAGGSAGQGA